MPTTPETKTLLSWEINEFTPYERGKLWFVIATLVSLALIIYGIITTNFLFAIIVLIFALVIALTVVRKPGILTVHATDMGLEVGERFYPYYSIANFAIVYEPPEVKDLHLEFKKGLFDPHLILPFETQNPMELRELLIARHVKEDTQHTEESFTEFLARILKI